MSNVTTLPLRPGRTLPPQPRSTRDAEQDQAVSHHLTWEQIRQGVFLLTHANGKRQMAEKLLDLAAEIERDFSS